MCAKSNPGWITSGLRLFAVLVCGGHSAFSIHHSPFATAKRAGGKLVTTAMIISTQHVCEK